MNVALKTSSKYCFGDITEENIWGIFAQRMAAAIKFLFSSFFSSEGALVAIPPYDYPWRQQPLFEHTPVLDNNFKHYDFCDYDYYDH